MWSGANGNVQYNQASMGWYNDNSNFEWSVSYKARGWWAHNLVAYMESHDEERLMYRNITFGNMMIQSGDTIYNTREKHTALNRMAEAAALFFTVPGPKMLWEFGERGFDYSINWPSMTSETRTDKKPPKWDYMNDPYRLMLYKKYAALINLKKNYSIFKTSNYDMNVGSWDKRVRLQDDGYVNSDMDAVVLGNFDVVTQNVWPEFPHDGKWYDYFTGDSINILANQTAGNNFTFQYGAGEYHIYTDKRLPVPDLYVDTTMSVQETAITDNFKTAVFPNPFSDEQTISYSLAASGKVVVEIYDVIGSKVITLTNCDQQAGLHYIMWDGTNSTGEKVKSGYYFCKITSGNYASTNKIVFIGN